MKTQHAKAGEFDPSFNGGRPLRLEFEGYERHLLQGMAAGRDGLIYVSGERTRGFDFSNSEYFIIALDAQGIRHAGFDRDGVAAGKFFKTDQAGVSVRSEVFALHYAEGSNPADDRLYLLGQYTYQKNDGPRSTYPAVACYLIDGSPDTAFGTNGICIFAGLEGDSVPSFASPEPAGSTTTNSESRELPNRDATIRWSAYGGRFYIQVLSSDHRRVLLISIDFRGVVDWNFGVNGVQVVERGLQFVPFGMFINTDGIYLCGRTFTDEVLWLFQATIARLDHRGVVDASYGSNGFQDFVVGTEHAELHSLVPLSPEYFITAGYARRGDPSGPVFVFVPLLLSCDDRGGVNPGFNGGSPVLIEGAPGGWRDLAVDADALTVLGSGSDGGFIGRFLHSGQMDSSFASGAGLRRLTELPSDVRLMNLMVRPDRSIVFLGWGAISSERLSAGVIGVLTGQ